MVKHSIACICLFALIVAINATRTIDEIKAEVQDLDKKLIEKLNKIDELERSKVNELKAEAKKDAQEFEHLLEDIEGQAKRIKRQASYSSYSAPAPAAAPSYQAPAPAAAPSYQAPAPAAAPSYSAPAPAAAPAYGSPAPAAAPAYGSSYGGSGDMQDFSQQQQQQLPVAPQMDMSMMNQQQMFPQQQMFAASQQFPAMSARSTLGAPLAAMNPLVGAQAVSARSTLGKGGIAPFEKLRLAPFTALGSIRKLSYNGADPTVQLNANGNPLPNTCSRGYSEPIWEGFQITESYCRCPEDNSYGFTCQEGFGNPCATTDQQFFPADTRISNNYFIHCSNYIPYLKKCPAGLVWDQELTTCNWPPSYGQPSAGASGYGSSSYSAPAPAAAPSYQAPAPAAAPSYQAPAPAAAPSYSAPAPAAAPSYQAPAPAAAPSYQAPAPAAAPSYSAPAPAAAPYMGGFGGR